VLHEKHRHDLLTTVQQRPRTLLESPAKSKSRRPEIGSRSFTPTEPIAVLETRNCAYNSFPWAQYEVSILVNAPSGISSCVGCACDHSCPRHTNTNIGDMVSIECSHTECSITSDENLDAIFQQPDV
jgi:hypothetical protein